MKSKINFLSNIILLFSGIIFSFTAAVFAQGMVKAEASPSATMAAPSATITVNIDIDVSPTIPAQVLGSFSGTLKWNAAVLSFTTHSGLKVGFTGVVGTSNTATGQLNFNGANVTGGAGKLNVLTLTFNVIGANGSSSALDLDFSAMAAALTFVNLMPLLTVTDGAVTITTTRVENRTASGGIPAAFALWQNHPNPFSNTDAGNNAATAIAFELPRPSQVRLTIFNVLGQKVRTLLDAALPAGKHTGRWDGHDDGGRRAPAGIYIYRMEAGERVFEKKLLKLR